MINAIYKFLYLESFNFTEIYNIIIYYNICNIDGDITENVTEIYDVSDV